jgi:hypothetical protein
MKCERIASSAAPVGPVASDEPSFYNTPLSRLIQLLRDEVKSGGPSGALDAEHLAHALAARLFTLMNPAVLQRTASLVATCTPMSWIRSSHHRG